MSNTKETLTSKSVKGRSRSADQLLVTQENFHEQGLEEALEYSSLSAQELLNRHLSEFNSSVREITGELNPYLDSILDAQYLLAEEPEPENEIQEHSFTPFKETCCLKDFFESGKRDIETVSPSIEDLLNSPEFVECLNSISNDAAGGMPCSLEDQVSAINEKIRDITMKKTAEKISSTSSQGPDNDDLYSTKNIVSGTFAREFYRFCNSILDVTKKGLKDVFQDSHLQESVLGSFCLEIFKQLKCGTLKDYSDIAGPKHILRKIKDDKVPKPFISNEDDDEAGAWLSMRSLYECLLENQKECCIVEALHRVLLIGEYDEVNRWKVEEQFQHHVAAVQEDILDAESKLTGALLLFKRNFIHVAEGSTDAIDALIKATATIVEEKYLKQAKIVTKYNDIPNRHFKYWKSTYVKKKDRYTEETCDQTISGPEFVHKIKDFQRQVRKIGIFAHNVPYSNFQEKMQSLTQIHLFPTDDLFTLILERDFCLTPKSYVDMYMTQQIFKSVDDYEKPPAFIPTL